MRPVSCGCAGHRRPGAAAAHAAHRPGVHGPEAGPRHQAVPPDRAREGGLLQAVRLNWRPAACCRHLTTTH